MRLLELAIWVAIRLKLSLLILLFEMLSLSNFELFNIKEQNCDSQSLYESSPKLLYSTINCLSFGFLCSALNILINPSEEISLDFIYSDYTRPCCSRNKDNYLAPSSRMKRSFITILALSRNDSKSVCKDIHWNLNFFLEIKNCKFKSCNNEVRFIYFVLCYFEKYFTLKNYHIFGKVKTYTKS